MRNLRRSSAGKENIAADYVQIEQKPPPEKTQDGESGGFKKWLTILRINRSVAFITSYKTKSNAEDLREGVVSNVVSYIQKPITMTTTSRLKYVGFVVRVT